MSVIEPYLSAISLARQVLTTHRPDQIVYALASALVSATAKLEEESDAVDFLSRQSFLRVDKLESGHTELSCDDGEVQAKDLREAVGKVREKTTPTQDKP